jgi:PAS domain S-box-containing protein
MSPKDENPSERSQRELALCRAELEQARSYLQGILQNASDLIFATDVQGLLVSLSKGGERILGYKTWELVGREFSELAARRSDLLDAMEEAIVRGSASRLDIPLKAKDGRLVWCNISIVVLTNRSGQRVGAVGICQDMSQWKEFQAKLRNVERFAEMGRLAGGIAHEINNPLAVIQEIVGWARTLLRDEKGLPESFRSEMEKALLDILEQTRRGRTITHQLLGFVRDVPPSWERVDLGDVVRKAIGFLGHEIRREGVSVEVVEPEGRVESISDPRLLEQVMVNLLSNALDAIEEKGVGGGRIVVEIVRREGAWEIRVSDTGTGIDEAHREHIFELLYTTKSPGKGTGLGLPISKRIVEQLGGEMGFETEVGRGTTFWFRIPDRPTQWGD